MKKIWRNDYIWNTVAGAINAAEAVVMSMIVTRYGLLSDAGILSLAFALGNVLMTIGKFGGRVFQVTDAKNEFSFCMYLLQRVLTVFIMLICLAGLLLFSGYTVEKRNAVLLIGLIYLLESLEDCVWGHFQLHDRLYIGAQMFSSRWTIILVAFFAVMVISNNMIWALFFAWIAGLTVLIIWIFILFRIPGESGLQLNLVKTGEREQNYTHWLPDLFKQTFPLFLASFCSMFISNIPKFAIDRYMSNEVQACYGFVAMPVFVVGMLNQFIYQPAVVRLTDEFYNGSMDKFCSEVKKQMFIVGGLCAVCLLGAGLIGVPVLSFIYHTDLRGYWKELVILQIAGGFLALSGYFTVLLTLMRKQKIILYGYVGTLVLGIAILNVVVKWKGTMGASIGYSVVMMLLFVFYFIAYKKLIMEKYSE